MTLPAALDYLRPLVLPDLIRVGRDQDGGYVVSRATVEAADHLLSFGLSYDWSFELEFRRHNRAAPIHAYDHTVTTGSVLRRALGAWRTQGLRAWLWTLRDAARYLIHLRHFSERVVARREEPRDAPIATILERAGTARRIFVKMDIEGSEYAVMPALLDHADRISAMVLEIHDVTARRAEFEACIRLALRHFEIVHLHANNYGGAAPDGLPDVMEITFVARALCPPGAARRTELPLPLDRPCAPGRPDLPIRFAPDPAG